MFYLSPIIFEQYYNCNQRSYEEWREERSPNLYLGIVYMSLGVIFISLYIPSVCTLRSKEFVKISAYKIMFVLGIIDIIALSIICLLAGYFTITGSIFCLNQKLNYFTGMIALGCWCSSCLINYILAFSRIFELYNPYTCNLIFDGNRTYIVLLIPISYGTYFALFTSPLLYTSKSYALSVDPYSQIENPYPSDFDYSNSLLTINDTSLLFILPASYLIFFYLLYQKYSGSKTKLQFSNLQKTLMQQTILITTSYFLASLSYTYFSFNQENIIFSVWGSLMWIFSHSGASLVYIFLNKSIQSHIISNYLPKAIKKLFKSKSKDKRNPTTFHPSAAATKSIRSRSWNAVIPI